MEQQHSIDVTHGVPGGPSEVSRCPPLAASIAPEVIVCSRQQQTAAERSSTAWRCSALRCTALRREALPCFGPHGSALLLVALPCFALTGQLGTRATPTARQPGQTGRKAGQPRGRPREAREARPGRPPQALEAHGRALQARPRCDRSLVHFRLPNCFGGAGPSSHLPTEGW